MTNASTERSRFWTVLAGSAALALVLAAPGIATAADYVDDPAYSQQYQRVGASIGDEATEEEGAQGIGSAGAQAMDDEEDATQTASADDEEMTADEEEDMAAAGDEGDDVAMADEEVEVTAPAIREEPSRSVTQPGRLTTSRHVRYEDLDLTTQAGARELRDRVREAASEVCDTLASVEPADSADYRPCYRQALQTAMPRANAAIEDARLAYSD
jgi:UrcA family protein